MSKQKENDEIEEQKLCNLENFRHEKVFSERTRERRKDGRKSRVDQGTTCTATADALCYTGFCHSHRQGREKVCVVVFFCQGVDRVVTSHVRASSAWMIS